LRQSKPGRKKVTAVSIKDYEELESELARKEKALGEMTVMFTTLKKIVWGQVCSWLILNPEFAVAIYCGLPGS
jgi:hypothetical protein